MIEIGAKTYNEQIHSTRYNKKRRKNGASTDGQAATKNSVLSVVSGSAR